MMPTLETDRLVLRPFHPADAPTVQRICGDWDVARMLARVPHPYPGEFAEEWIASHDAAWRRGDEAAFCIELDGNVIGSVVLRRSADDAYALGYWLGRDWSGRGIATEAARAAVRFAFDRLGAARLTSGHFHDNPASGYVLKKCGFRYIGESRVPCVARGEAVAHRNFEFRRDEMKGRPETP
jgi:RimJ/RimL family protein N-acetyltransferase